MDWYPYNPIEWQKDTLDFSIAEDGAYHRLIDHYYTTRTPLPANPKALARIIGISISDFQAIAEQVLSKFQEVDGLLHHKRCDIELNRQDSLSKKRSNAGKKAAEKRNKNKDKQASDEQLPNNSPDTREEKTREDKESKPTTSKKRKSAMTTKWTLSIEDKEWAEKTANQNNTAIDCSVEVEKFRDWHLGKGSMQLDWSATWRTWVRNFIKWAKERNPDLTGTLSHEAQKQIRKDAELKYGGKANG